MKAKTTQMYPSLHQQIADAVSDEIPQIWFNKDDNHIDCNNEYTTHIMGRFICYNKSCSTNGWGSKMVSIMIRGYPNNGYNALVFKQRCKCCKELGVLKLDNKSYIDRVVYRVKMWANVRVDVQSYSSGDGPPHEEELCEGCKRGICRK